MKDKKKKNGSFYIALSVCAVMIALMSYVGNTMKKGDEIDTEIALDNIEKSYDEELSEIDYEEILEPEAPENEEKDIIDIDEVEVPVEAEETAAEEIVDEFLPGLPSSGRILSSFSGGQLVYYETLDDWRSHQGVDIEARVGEDVYICESGVVEKIYSNNMGGCILVDHENGYKSLYACLGETNLVNVGDRLSMGETIGRVGDTAVGDLVTTPHVHFEMYREGIAIDPLDIITIE